jgi:hypothetical protein
MGPQEDTVMFLNIPKQPRLKPEAMAAARSRARQRSQLGAERQGVNLLARRPISGGGEEVGGDLGGGLLSRGRLARSLCGCHSAGRAAVCTAETEDEHCLDHPLANAADLGEPDLSHSEPSISQCWLAVSLSCAA